MTEQAELESAGRPSNPGNGQLGEDPFPPPLVVVIVRQQHRECLVLTVEHEEQSVRREEVTPEQRDPS